jgi:DTW domain-containing protein YfiP
MSKASSSSSSSSNIVVKQTSRRPLCHGCDFPLRTCICPALLPPVPLQSLLHNCRIVVIQHPHEVRKKNRSLPLVELCLFGKKNKEEAEGNSTSYSSSRNNSDNNNEGLDANNHLQTKHRIADKSGLITTTKGVTKGETSNSNSSINLSSQQNQQPQHSTAATTDDFVMKTIIARRLGIYCDSNVMKRIHDPNEVVVLVFPHDKALDLDDGLRLAEKRCKSSNNINNNNDGDTAKKKKMTLIFIDATWKYAKEMDKGTDLNNGWPTNLIRVQLTPSSSSSSSTSSSYSSTVNGGDEETSSSSIATATTVPAFVERRFHIRTPPSSNHLCTAECIAYIVSRVESNPIIYTSIMTTVDYMVTVWNQLSILANTDDGNNSRGIKTEMSQKKLKILMPPSSTNI